MDEYIKNLWKNNKILFLLLLPLVILYIFRDIVISLLISSSRKISKEARERDDKLRVEQDRLDAAADAKKRESDKKEEQIQNLPDDEDWHKRRK